MKPWVLMSASSALGHCTLSHTHCPTLCFPHPFACEPPCSADHTPGHSKLHSFQHPQGVMYKPEVNAVLHEVEQPPLGQEADTGQHLGHPTRLDVGHRHRPGQDRVTGLYEKGINSLNTNLIILVYVHVVRFWNSAT